LGGLAAGLEPQLWFYTACVSAYGIAGRHARQLALGEHLGNKHLKQGLWLAVPAGTQGVGFCGMGS